MTDYNYQPSRFEDGFAHEGMVTTTTKLRFNQQIKYFV